MGELWQNLPPHLLPLPLPLSLSLHQAHITVARYLASSSVEICQIIATAGENQSEVGCQLIISWNIMCGGCGRIAGLQCTFNMWLLFGSTGIKLVSRSDVKTCPSCFPQGTIQIHHPLGYRRSKLVVQNSQCSKDKSQGHPLYISEGVCDWHWSLGSSRNELTTLVTMLIRGIIPL